MDSNSSKEITNNCHINEENSSETNYDVCSICKKKIPHGAKKCISCNSYQNILYRVFFNIDLQTLTALIPVLTLAFLVLKNQVVIHKSDLLITIINIHDNRIQVYVSNVGDRSGILIDQANIYINTDGNNHGRQYNLTVDPHSKFSSLIQPGNSVIVDYLAITINRIPIRLDPCILNQTCNCEILFKVYSFNQKSYTRRIKCSDFYKFKNN